MSDRTPLALIRERELGRRLMVMPRWGDGVPLAIAGVGSARACSRALWQTGAA